MSNDENERWSTTLAMLAGHWAEIIVLGLVGLLSYIASDFVAEFRKHTTIEQQRLNELDGRIRAGEITFEGLRYRMNGAEQDIAKLQDKMDSVMIPSERTWKELQEYRREKRSQYVK